MINNNQKLQQMALHKQNNYTSPEVVKVDFKTEKGFYDSGNFKAGRLDTTDPDHPTVRNQGTQSFDAAEDPWYTSTGYNS